MAAKNNRRLKMLGGCSPNLQIQSSEQPVRAELEGSAMQNLTPQSHNVMSEPKPRYNTQLEFYGTNNKKMAANRVKELFDSKLAQK